MRFRSNGRPTAVPKRAAARRRGPCLDRLASCRFPARLPPRPHAPRPVQEGRSTSSSRWRRRDPSRGIGPAAVQILRNTEALFNTGQRLLDRQPLPSAHPQRNRGKLRIGVVAAALERGRGRGQTNLASCCLDLIGQILNGSTEQTWRSAPCSSLISLGRSRRPINSRLLLEMGGKAAYFRLAEVGTSVRPSAARPLPRHQADGHRLN